MHRKFFVYLPGFQGSAEEEWKECLRQIIDTHRSGLRPLKLNIYTLQHDFGSYLNLKSIIASSLMDSLGEEIPAFNVTLHPPESPWKIAVEAQFIAKGDYDIVTKLHESVPYVVIDLGSSKEIWGAGLMTGHFPGDTRKAASDAFDIMVGMLRNEGMTLNNLVRQWNYIGNILDLNQGIQNYQIFNEVRSEYYQRYRTVKEFPAATGVGMQLGGVILDFYAMSSGGATEVKVVDNPDQVNAYQYGQNVLKGLTEKGKALKHPPQFERALLVSGNPYSTLFISGTASIIGQETIGRGDIEKQTLVSIGNIRKLTDPLRIASLSGSGNIIPGQYLLIRTYIKRREDFDAVKSICKSHFPDTPAVYIMADICRDDLLTEIEAELLYKM